MTQFHSTTHSAIGSEISRTKINPNPCDTSPSTPPWESRRNYNLKPSTTCPTSKTKNSINSLRTPPFLGKTKTTSSKSTKVSYPWCTKKPITKVSSPYSLKALTASWTLSLKAKSTKKTTTSANWMTTYVLYNLRMNKPIWIWTQKSRRKTAEKTWTGSKTRGKHSSSAVCLGQRVPYIWLACKRPVKEYFHTRKWQRQSEAEYIFLWWFNLCSLFIFLSSQFIRFTSLSINFLIDKYFSLNNDF